MKPFEYVAIGAGGARVEGREYAASPLALDRELERRGLTLASARVAGNARTAVRARLSNAELLVFTHQLATLVAAGIPLVEGLEGIGRRMRQPPERAVVEGVVAALRDGAPLSDALGKFPRAFPEVYRASVRAGEASGALDRVLLRLARHMEWRRAMRATTLQTLIYPAILLCALVGLVVLLLTFVLPRLMTLFPGGRESLPAQTRFLMALSDALRGHAWGLSIGAAVAVAAAVRALRTERGRLAWDRALLGVPGLGALARQLATSSFASTAATLHAAGCDVFTVLGVAGATCGNAALAACIERVAHAARRGSTLTQAFEREPLVDPLLSQLVGVGEKSGDLASALDQLVAYYDDDTPRRVKRFLSLLEPALLLSAAAVVGFILLAALLPVFQLYENLK